MSMRIDMRDQAQIRAQVHAGLSALRVQGRQIWGARRHTFPEIVARLTVGVGDLARLACDGRPEMHHDGKAFDVGDDSRELKKELGNVIFSMIRWIDDLGLDVLECLDLAIEAQEKFANSGRQR